MVESLGIERDSNNGAYLIHFAGQSDDEDVSKLVRTGHRVVIQHLAGRKPARIAVIGIDRELIFWLSVFDEVERFGLIANDYPLTLKPAIALDVSLASMREYCGIPE